MSVVAYTTLASSDQFIRHIYLGHFIIATTSITRWGLPLTQEAIAKQKLYHDENKYSYNECQAIEQALQK